MINAIYICALIILIPIAILVSIVSLALVYRFIINITILILERFSNINSYRIRSFYFYVQKL